MTQIPFRRFVYLNLSDHPRGVLQLEGLVAAGFVPVMVIDEVSPLAEAGRAGQLAELRQVPGYREPAATRQFCAEHGIRYETVADHNDSMTEKLLAELAPDLAVLGDNRILKPHILARVPGGIVNVHPGLLPEVRGNNPYIWALIHNLPQGASVHLINAGVDRGPLLLTRRVTLDSVAGLPELIDLLNTTCAELLVEVMRQVANGTATLTPQHEDGRLTFREARPEIRAVAATILRDRHDAAQRSTARTD